LHRRYGFLGAQYPPADARPLLAFIEAPPAKLALNIAGRTYWQMYSAILKMSFTIKAGVGFYQMAERMIFMTV
jgi:hypothetical protein